MIRTDLYTITPEKVKKLKEIGYTTVNGVTYDMNLAGPEGANYWIVDEGQSDVVLKIGEAHIRNNFDVVGAVRVIKIADS